MENKIEYKTNTFIFRLFKGISFLGGWGFILFILSVVFVVITFVLWVAPQIGRSKFMGDNDNIDTWNEWKSLLFHFDSYSFWLIIIEISLAAVIGTTITLWKNYGKAYKSDIAQGRNC